MRSDDLSIDQKRVSEALFDLTECAVPNLDRLPARLRDDSRERFLALLDWALEFEAEEVPRLRDGPDWDYMTAIETFFETKLSTFIP